MMLFNTEGKLPAPQQTTLRNTSGILFGGGSSCALSHSCGGALGAAPSCCAGGGNGGGRGMSELLAAPAGVRPPTGSPAGVRPPAEDFGGALFGLGGWTGAPRNTVNPSGSWCPIWLIMSHICFPLKGASKEFLHHRPAFIFAAAIVRFSASCLPQVKRLPEKLVFAVVSLCARDSLELGTLQPHISLNAGALSGPHILISLLCKSMS